MNEDLDEFIFINIPDFKVYYVRNEKIIWSTRAQIGKSYRQTPVSKSKITHLEFNPTGEDDFHALKDIYSRDKAVLEILNAELRPGRTPSRQ